MLNAIIGIILSGTFSLGQVVFTGPGNPNYCEEVLKREKIQPNLELRKSVHLTGTVKDIVGAPIPNSTVELRTYIFGKQAGNSEERADKCVWRVYQFRNDQTGKVSPIPFPTRAFQQPVKLECPAGESTCDLKIALRANITDQPDSGCPIQ